MAQNSQIAACSPHRTSRRRCKCSEEAPCPHGAYPRVFFTKPLAQNRELSEERGDQREEERVWKKAEETKGAIEREIKTYIEALVTLGEEKKRVVDSAAESLIRQLKQNSSKGHISPVTFKNPSNGFDSLSVCFGQLHLQSLISFPTAREETVTFGAERIAGLYDYKGQFSQESRHCLSLCVSKDIILTGVNIAAVYAKTNLTSFDLFAGDQSSKRRIYQHKVEVSLQSAGENAIPLRLNQGVCVRAGEILTLRAEVAGEQCYCVSYHPNSHYYHTSEANVGIYLLPSPSQSESEGLFYGLHFKLA